MIKIIEKIKDYVKKEFEKADKKLYPEAYYYKNHILPAYKFAVELAYKYESDRKIVEIAILLHDIGLIDLPEEEEHDEVGAKRARDFLTQLGLDKKRINKIINCIRCHDCRDIFPKTTEEKVVATADALSHLLTPWFIIKSRYSKMPIDNMLKWCADKIDKDFNKIQFNSEKEKFRIFFETWKKILKEDEG